MPRFLRSLLILASLAGAGAAAGQSVLLPPAPSTPPPAQVALIGGWQAADGTHVAAVEIRLAPGWHTYWRVPGDAGIPPALDWSRSRNLARVSHEWPRPVVFDSYGMQMIGYADRLVLPVVLTPERADAPIEVELDLFFGVCEDICVPADAQVTAHLAPGRPAEGRAAIEAARAERPRTPAEAGVTAVSCGLDAGRQGPEIVASVTFAHPPAPEKLMVIEPGQRGLRVGAAATEVHGRTVSARAPLRGGGAIDRSMLRLTLIGPDRAVEIRGCQPGG
jgi:DsbC/DsbD-like thiol-disulfide interchange protein